MRLFIMIFVLALLLLVPCLASADVAEGLKAYQANDVKTALSHWKPAAEQGNPDAQYWLGRLYEEGRGVPQDFEEAHMWYNLAAAQGNEEARKAREALSTKMTREQLVDAQKRARTWRPLGSTKAPTAQAPAGPSPQEATAVLFRAAEQGNEEAVKGLLSRGANVNGRDAAGWTPLLRAAVGGHLAVARILIEAGADVNAANPDGNTPLMGAALAGNKELVELLHQKGAKLDAKNQKGQTALTFAQQKGNNEVLALLRKVSEPQAGELMRDPTTGMEFIFVRGGCFQMGDTFGDGDSSEKPVHEVCVGGFYMGKYEVTQGQWQRVMGNNPSYFKKGDNYPVEQVSWNDAQDFIRRLSQSSGQTYRLPTEAEWEYAARGGGKSEKWAGTNLEYQLGEYGWFSANSGSQTRPVGQKRPNGLGLHDMSGNVWEWCQDWYDEGYYGKSPKDNPKGPDSGQSRVLRGGSWNFNAWLSRAPYRVRNSPTDRYNNIGFRLVLSPR